MLELAIPPTALEVEPSDWDCARAVGSLVLPGALSSAAFSALAVGAGKLTQALLAPRASSYRPPLHDALPTLSPLTVTEPVRGLEPPLASVERPVPSKAVSSGFTSTCNLTVSPESA